MNLNDILKHYNHGYERGTNLPDLSVENELSYVRGILTTLPTEKAKAEFVLGYRRAKIDKLFKVLATHVNDNCVHYNSTEFDQYLTDIKNVVYSRG